MYCPYNGKYYSGYTYFYDKTHGLFLHLFAFFDRPFCRKKLFLHGIIINNMKTRFIIPAFLLLVFAQLNVSAQGLTSKNTHNINIGGWIDGQYRLNYDDKAASSFQVRRARLDFKGTLSKTIDFRLQADMASSPKLIDAFVRMRFNKAFALQIGQFKIPFSLENILSPLELELTDNAQVISALSGYKDVTGIASYANGRDIGLMMSGTLFSDEIKGEETSIVKYDIGVFGGGGINVAPSRWGKDVSGRLSITPYVRHLTISASTYWGNYNLPNTTAAGETKGARKRFAVGAQYANGRIMLRGEYLWGMTGMELLDDITNTYSLDNVESRGCYITASRWFDMQKVDEGQFVPKIRPILRWDYYAKNVSDASSKTYYWAGVECWAQKCLRFQLAYRLHKDEVTSTFDHCLTAMTTVKF